MIPSNDFGVWIKTEEQLHSILNALESEGIKWRQGQKATQFIPKITLPFGLVVKRGRASLYSPLDRQIMWNSDFDSIAPMYSAEELIEYEAPVNYSSVFGSIAF